MNKIDGSPKSLKQLLLNTKYTIHYYQREYMWKTKQISDLVSDLTDEFLNYYNPEDKRENVNNYGAYFMGSIVLTGRDNAIIDGQQRLTSLTLLLLYLRRRLSDSNQTHESIDGMIYSEAYGKKSFNINVEEREDCLQALYDNKEYEYTGRNESIKNIISRYSEIPDYFPAEIDDKAIPFFIDWLIERVFFIEIVTANEQDAHKVFVTMNDRGLSLTPTEMLKGYLLSEISNDTIRESSNTKWKKQIALLREMDPNEDDAFIKNWLRAQYAISIRETKAGSDPKDFDLIGSGFHTWVKNNGKEILHLNESNDYEEIIDKFVYFADIYLSIKKYENEFAQNHSYIYYNSHLGFTLQSQLLLAPICYNDTSDTVNKKLDLTSKFIDLYIYSRVVNYKSCDYSTIKNYVFNTTKRIRNRSVEELSNELKELLKEFDFKLTAINEWQLNGFTKKYMKHMLARITGFIEESTDATNNYIQYINRDLKDPYEVEHITPDHFDWYKDKYYNEQEFISFRNNIGDLLLLPKSINASLKDEKYDYKVKKYCSNEGNIYAASLGEITYQNNPRFLNFIKENGLNFKAYNEFGKDQIIEREKLVEKLVSIIWNINNLNVDL
ncbi:DUF262 domain-containing protein [Candidatus Saccharibacteria bacterium]|nr:DUF262 domain-containing protein [Candidatus Saccharibacteria bacterium]